MIYINLVEATPERRSYGITHVGATAHDVRGATHNRNYPHRVKVWDNTGRPLGQGLYEGPDGKPTPEPTTVYLDAESIVVSNPPTQVRYGTELTIGDEVMLRYPDGTMSERLTIKTRSLADPVLVPSV